MTEWYYRDSKSRKIGPLTPEEFAHDVAEGLVQPETRVWHSGLPQWTTYAALLAYDEQWAAVASGPATCVAPPSSSYSTLVALGISAVSRPAHGAGSATPVASEVSGLRTRLEQCPACQEDVPSHLFKELGQRRICGFCVHRLELKARRHRLREARGADSSWIGRLLVRCALIAGVLVFARMIFFDLKHGGRGAAAPSRPPGPAPAQAR